ncbi:MAG: hypothetical protein U0441_08635 [Polyangiaceae bacterium]
MSADLSLAIGDRGLPYFTLAFAITQIVEVPIYVRALRGAESRTWRRRALIGFGASLSTHPIVWFVMPWAAMFLYERALRLGCPTLDVTGRTWLYGAVAEGFAVIAEALYLKAFRATRPLLWSLFANAASVVVGTIVVRLL